MEPKKPHLRGRFVPSLEEKRQIQRVAEQHQQAIDRHTEALIRFNAEKTEFLRKHPTMTESDKNELQNIEDRISRAIQNRSHIIGILEKFLTR